jgi:hypothetical protein
MSYIIDGHNLIPKIPGLSLAQLDDEAHLIRLLVTFCQKKKTRVVVFFDRAAPGHQAGSSFGAVTAIFVPERQKADDAIHAYLAVHRREARNFTVVSSDRQVQRDAASFHARVLSTEAFAAMLVKQNSPGAPGRSETEPVPLSAREVAEWEKIFGCYDN